jgi:hypothetical protein
MTLLREPPSIPTADMCSTGILEAARFGQGKAIWGNSSIRLATLDKAWLADPRSMTCMANGEDAESLLCEYLMRVVVLRGPTRSYHMGSCMCALMVLLTCAAWDGGEVLKLNPLYGNSRKRAVDFEGGRDEGLKISKS